MSSQQLVLRVGYCSRTWQTQKMLKNKDLAWSYDTLVDFLKILYLNDLYPETINSFHIFGASHSLINSPTSPSLLHTCIHLSIGPSFCLFPHLAVCSVIHLFIYLSNCSSTYPSLNLLIHSSPYLLFIYPSTHPPTHSLIYLQIQLQSPTPNISLDPPASPSICLFLCLPFIYPAFFYIIKQPYSPLSIHLFLYPPFCLFIHLPVHLFIEFLSKANFDQKPFYVPGL